MGALVLAIPPFIFKILSTNTNFGVQDHTGQFKEISREPTRDRLVTTDFTETLQQWRNPYNPSLDKVCNVDTLDKVCKLSLQEMLILS